MKDFLIFLLGFALLVALYFLAMHTLGVIASVFHMAAMQASGQ